uniref:Uncharacterized protein n=1 Tax=Anguilla anguilla TaxID=7936 RepID=A0A0E9PQV4_ANGAN
MYLLLGSKSPPGISWDGNVALMVLQAASASPFFL